MFAGDRRPAKESMRSKSTGSRGVVLRRTGSFGCVDEVLLGDACNGAVTCAESAPVAESITSRKFDRAGLEDNSFYFNCERGGLTIAEYLLVRLSICTLVLSWPRRRAIETRANKVTCFVHSRFCLSRAFKLP